MSNTRLDLEERCEKCAHFHRLKHNFKKGIGFEESTCCDVLLHLPDSTDDTKPWVQEVSRLGMCEMFTEVKQDKTTTKNDLGVDCISREDALMCLTGEFEDKQYEPSELVSIFSKRIKHLPSVTPQEPIAWIVGKNNAKIAVKNMPIDKLQKICAIIGDEQEPILDKIREEIKVMTSNRGFLSCSVGYIHKEIDNVFDKYKAESEG